MQPLSQEIDVSPAGSFSLNSLLRVSARPVLHRLSVYGVLPQQLVQIISRASVRLLDSDLTSQTPHDCGPGEEIGLPLAALAHQAHAMTERILELMAHVEWLAAQERIELTTEESAARDFIADATLTMTRFGRYHGDDVQRALALKFAANELLLHLVSSAAVKDFSDQRDLLAFTKMAGSSYRCYHELRASMGAGNAVNAQGCQ
ncbi:MAG: hypothetical protein ABI171_12865 [Collimonas sp.]|uniref:hypothetical protein n=1 Tax=Collimonas sp. TaxID=1963772 RepID=UPI003267A1FA